MGLSDIKTPESVLKAIHLFDELGREAFLEKFGFGKAKQYFLVREGKHYDSKAIAGVAHQFEFPEVGALRNTNFSGGEQTVKRKLEELGFTVEKVADTLHDSSITVINDIPIGSLWRRADIHDLLGGQRQGGISTPDGKPYIILFSSPRGEEFGYQDGWHEDGFYHYTGEGQEGPMRFTKGNKAIRDHARDGKILLLFETEKNGLRRFVGPMLYAGHSIEQLPDKTGAMRDAIVFTLMETSMSSLTPPEKPESREALGFVSSRQAALEAAQTVAERVPTAQDRRKRSQTVSRYVQERALGYCEVCGFSAPFRRPDGTPYLETHHTTQLADDGPDAPQDVVAACPTCHRQIHHGHRGQSLNQVAHDRVKQVEEAIAQNRLKIVTAAVIRSEQGDVLVARRKLSQALGSKWEFPGGKVHPGETLEECITREILEELGVKVKQPRPFFMVDYRYPEFDIRLCAMATIIEDGVVRLNDHEECRWISPQELMSIDLAPADVHLAKALVRRYEFFRL